MKSDSQSRSWTKLTNPEAIQMFENPRSRRFIEVFIGREMTISQAANELGLTMSAMLYRVEKLLHVQLIRVVKVTKRAGRPIKHYRAVSDEFFIPFDVTHSDTLDTFRKSFSKRGQFILDNSILHAWEKASESNKWGVHIFRHEETINMNLIPEDAAAKHLDFFENLLEDDMPPVWDQLFTLKLDPEDAKSLQKALHHVYIFYHNKVNCAARTEYIVRLAITPVNNTLQ